MTTTAMMMIAGSESKAKLPALAFADMFNTHGQKHRTREIRALGDEFLIAWRQSRKKNTLEPFHYFEDDGFIDCGV